MVKKLRLIILQLQENLFYGLAIALLAIGSIVMLVYEMYVVTDPKIISYLQRADLVIACIFLADFFAGLWATKSGLRTQYWSHNWLNLISSIPLSSEFLRALRILRLLRAIRVIRAGMNLWFASRRYANARKQGQT